MSQLKVYDNRGAGPPTHVTREIIAALGEASHISQADLLIVACTKTAARDRLSQLGLRASLGDLRVGMGNNLDILRDAGLLAVQDTVLALGRISARTIAQVSHGGIAVVVARLQGGTLTLTEHGEKLVAEGKAERDD